MDGVDASLIETDGEALIKIKGSLNVPYEESFKLELIENISKKKISSQTELKLTQFHADAVSKLIEKENNASVVNPCPALTPVKLQLVCHSFFYQGFLYLESHHFRYTAAILYPHLQTARQTF